MMKFPILVIFALFLCVICYFGRKSLRQKRAVVRWVYDCLAVSVIVILIFNIIETTSVFPGAYFKTPSIAPDKVTVLYVQTPDGGSLRSWYVPATGEKRKQAVIFFHGNAEPLSHVFEAQKLVSAAGFASYSFEYRGYGESSGWKVGFKGVKEGIIPSEKSFYEDADAMYSYVTKREGVGSQDVIIWGYSLGTGPASYIGQKHDVGTLVLMAPYTSIPEVVDDRFFVKYLSGFISTTFPNKSYVANLKNTCVIAVHGKMDDIILYEHSPRLKERYQGTGSYTLLTSETVNHLNITEELGDEVVREVLNCVNSQE